MLRYHPLFHRLFWSDRISPIARAYIGAFWALSTLFCEGRGQEHQEYFYYRPDQPVGSDAIFNPITLLLNGSFDATRTENHTRDIMALPYRNDFVNVWDNITHPIRSINRYGWQAFRREEIINFDLDHNALQFLPNLMDHTVGYGMLFVKVREWYEDKDFPVPVVWSVGTSLVYQYMNEMIQNSGGRGTNVDCVSDILIFNTLGFVCFSFNGVNRFFTETVQLYEWSLQPVYVMSNHHLQNTGQEFVLRYPSLWSERWSPFLYWGVNSAFGLSYRYSTENSISVGLGVSVYKGIDKEYRGTKWRFLPTLRDGDAGLFLDNQGSLLASLIIEGPKLFNVQANIYPGLVNFGRVHPGIYIAGGQRDHFVAGITFAVLPISVGFESLK